MPMSSVSPNRSRRQRLDHRSVAHEIGGVQELMWARYGAYLESLQGEQYRRKVFDYIDREDSPRPVTYQMGLLRRVGFVEVDLLHKNACFAAFGAKKGRS
jgi:tRNA (cmo5U34)-methyltransferase